MKRLTAILMALSLAFPAWAALSLRGGRGFSHSMHVFTFLLPKMAFCAKGSRRENKSLIHIRIQRLMVCFAGKTNMGSHGPNIRWLRNLPQKAADDRQAGLLTAVYCEAAFPCLWHSGFWPHTPFTAAVPRGNFTRLPYSRIRRFRALRT